MGHNGPSQGHRLGRVRVKREAAERAQQVADKLACEAWNERLAQLGGPLQPSPSIRAAVAGGHPYLRLTCPGCVAGPRLTDEAEMIVQALLRLAAERDAAVKRLARRSRSRHDDGSASTRRR